MLIVIYYHNVAACQPFFLYFEKKSEGAQMSVLDFGMEGAVTLVPTSIESLKR